MSLDIWEERPKYRKTRKPKRDRHSAHRDNKTSGHRTINGRGVVGRLMR